MATINYTALLSLAEPVTGQETSVWGDDVNNGITQYVDIAVAGTNNLASDADVTLTLTSGSYVGTGITSTTAQYAILNCTGNRSTIRYINAPNSSKIYQIINNTTATSGGPYAVVIRGSTGPTTGVSVANGERCIVAWDTVAGDFVKIASSSFSGLTGVLPAVNGGTGEAGTITGLAYANGTSPYTAATAAQIVAAIGTTPIAIATTANNISGGSANQIVYQSGTGATTFATAPTGAQAGYVLGWNGTNFAWVAAPAATTATNLAGGGTYTIVYQSATGTTAYLTNGTTGQVLTANTGAAPSYVNQASLSVGYASTAGSATTAGSVSNLSGGGANTVVYQSATGTTAYLANGVTGQYLAATTGGAPQWASTSTIQTPPGKLYFYGQF